MDDQSGYRVAFEIARIAGVKLNAVLLDPISDAPFAGHVVASRERNGVSTFGNSSNFK